MRIIIDTREQAPYLFAGLEVETERGTLPTGDYSLVGFEDRVGIERKALDDLVGCLTHDRVRFEKELARARSYELFAVVVEANLDDVIHGRFRSQMTSKAALGSITALSVRYGVPFLFCGNRKGGEAMTYQLLSKYLREIRERFRYAEKVNGMEASR